MLSWSGFASARPDLAGEALVELKLDRCLTLTEARNGFASGHTVWKA